MIRAKLRKRKIKPVYKVVGAEVLDDRIIIEVSGILYKTSFPIEERYDKIKGLRYKGTNLRILEKHLIGLTYNIPIKEAIKLAKKLEIMLETELSTGYMHTKRAVEQAMIKFCEDDEVAGKVIANPSRWKTIDMKAKKIELPVTSEAMRLRIIDLAKWDAFEDRLAEVISSIPGIDDVGDIKCMWVQ